MSMGGVVAKTTREASVIQRRLRRPAQFNGIVRHRSASTVRRNGTTLIAVFQAPPSGLPPTQGPEITCAAARTPFSEGVREEQN
jgi:hypothetical protein